MNSPRGSFQSCCTSFFLILFLFSTSRAQVIIRDTVTITPRSTPLRPAAAPSSTPMVEVSFYIIDGSMPAGAIVQLGIRDTTWTMYAAGCSGKSGEAVGGMDFGLFPEGGYIGQVLYSNCYPGAEGTISYDDYTSPAPGAYVEVRVYLNGLGARRTIGYFKYEKPPLPAVRITASRNYQLAISEGNSPVIVYQEEHTPGIGSSYEPTIVWTPSKAINTEDYLPQVLAEDSVVIPISATATNISGSVTDYATLTVFKERFLTDFLVSLSKDTLLHSDTIAIYAQARDEEGKPIVIDDSTGISLYPDTNGEQYGGFLGYDTTTQKWLDLVYYVDAHFGRIKYVADGAIPDSVVPIEIAVVKPGFHPKGGFATAWVKGESLDHFEVKIIPDTVARRDTAAFTEGAKLMVQAKDRDEKDVGLNANMLLGFAIVTNEEYGTFIDAHGDTLKTTPVKLAGVRYGDAQGGLIRFAAVKKNPDSIEVCRIRVELQSDATKKGEKDVVVLEQTLKIVMEGEREVVPRNLNGSRTPAASTNANKKEFKVQLTRNKAAVPNHSFELTNDYVDGSGGHDHLTPRRDRNRHNYGYFILKRTGTAYDSPYTGQTQSDGRERFDYVSSFFGDRMRLRVESAQPNKKQFLWDTLSITEKVWNLVLLNDGAEYDLIGGTCKHHGPAGGGACETPDNDHWGEATVIVDLQHIAHLYHEEFADDPILKINDISLPYGGRFDINGRWEGNSFHQYHRLGIDVDIQRRWAIPSENEERFKQICKENGVIEPYPEDAAHFHLFFWDRNQ